jgi:hypothetical protein
MEEGNMKTKKISTIFLGIALAMLAITSKVTSGPQKPKVDTPIISCAGSTEGSIDIRVCAPSGTGATGAPAGFSIQWMTKAEFDVYGWPDDSGSPFPRETFCKASFSGNAFGSRYNLGPGDCVTVRIGDLLFDNGASTSEGCDVALKCGTTYVFRVFAHATRSLRRSDFTGNLECSTEACDPGRCTLTQGFWRTHPCDWPSPFVPGANGTASLTQCALTGNPNQQCACDSSNTIMLGSKAYTQCQLLCILATPAGGNGLISLAHQLIAAKLNTLNGAGCSSANSSIADADALIGNLVVPPIGSGSLHPSVTSALVTALNNYNNGSGGGDCPGHCKE